jgi:hypothetical protein
LKQLKQAKGLLHNEELYKTDDSLVSESDDLTQTRMRMALAGAGLTLLTVNAVLYPRLLKSVRRIFNSKNGNFPL